VFFRPQSVVPLTENCLHSFGKSSSLEISNEGAGLDGYLFHNENFPKDARENESVLEMKLG
jgi:hypothetical protein